MADNQTQAARLKEHILEAVSDSSEPLTFGKLGKILTDRLGAEKKVLKKAVDDLIAAGELTYTYRHGCSFIEKSFEKPVRVSERIVLVPYGMSFASDPGDVVIKMRHGVSFGSGDHPTTRLALRGIEQVFYENGELINGSGSSALDIGTGSGVLAIACLLFGVKKAMGIDTDSCARKESMENAQINGLGNRVEISDMPVEKIEGKFSIVTANLRYPTLIGLYPVMIGLTGKDSMLVFSGIKVSEANELSRFYLKEHFICLREEKEKDWAGLVFKRI
ncbi:MAG: 50S ribosomal protein L11 methyltransferase [Proteobacteria bacterium]|nr:50S ribosomal protein L11 methyltransferase [Pseudomonadota bacterium]